MRFGLLELVYLRCGCGLFCQRSPMLDFFFPPGGELALVRLSVLAGCDADAWWRRMWLLAGLMHP